MKETRIVLAPKARRNTARSEAERNSGEQINHILKPRKGVTENAIGSKISFIKRQIMCPQDHFEFFKKRDRSMMFFLPLDITTHLRDLRLTHRKRPISFLPRESRGVLERSRDPTGRVRLQFADQFRNRLVLSQLCQDVNMISRSVNDQRNSVFFANRTAQILMRPGANFASEPRFATFGRKNDVIQKIAIGGTHRIAPFRRPPSGATLVGTIHPEFRFAPPRALFVSRPRGALNRPGWILTGQMR
jgi:hypothetical protein